MHLALKRFTRSAGSPPPGGSATHYTFKVHHKQASRLLAQVDAQAEGRPVPRSVVGSPGSPTSPPKLKLVKHSSESESEVDKAMRKSMIAMSHRAPGPSPAPTDRGASKSSRK